MTDVGRDNVSQGGRGLLRQLCAILFWCKEFSFSLMMSFDAGIPPIGGSVIAEHWVVLRLMRCNQCMLRIYLSRIYSLAIILLLQGGETLPFKYEVFISLQQVKRLSCVTVPRLPRYLPRSGVIPMTGYLLTGNKCWFSNTGSAAGPYHLHLAVRGRRSELKNLVSTL